MCIAIILALLKVLLAETVPGEQERSGAMLVAPLVECLGLLFVLVIMQHRTFLKTRSPYV